MIKSIRPKEKDIIIQSLRGGVVPRLGLQHIQVGRNEELKSFVKNIETMVDGGTAFRLVVGEYGSGKTFFLSLVRSIALEKGLVVMNADLSPTKRLYSSSGQAKLLFSELTQSLSTRTKQDGGALSNILEKFISIARQEAQEKGRDVSAIIFEKLKDLNDYTDGYNFATAVSKYWEGYDTGNDVLKENALKWLRGEYSSKVETLRDLGIREYINDATFYNSLKLYSILVRKAGYKGLLINLDEMVNLYKIPTSVSRKSNYEVILNMLNDTLQGNLSGIGFVMGGTPDFLTDSYRGLYSYEALRSRLSENGFSNALGLIDYNSTVLRLSNLTQEEFLVLLQNLRHVFACGKCEDYLLPDNALIAFMNHCANRIGESYFRTPRTTIKAFLDLLSILEQYPSVKWTDVIENVAIIADTEQSGFGQRNISQSDNNADDEFASFKL
jgi:hypothetical protein